MKKQSFCMAVGHKRTTYFWQKIRFGFSFMLTMLLLGQPSGGLTISMVDVGPTAMTAQQLNAFQQAADIWEATFSDPVTVNFNIAFEPLGSGILGSTSSARTTHSYISVRAALVADASVAELPTVNSLPTSSLWIRDTNGDRFDSFVTMSTANAKALGLGTGLDTIYQNPPTGVDAIIRFSTLFASSFDYNPDDGISPGKRDFVGIALHEIGHALGFISLTDIQDNNPGFVLHPNVLDFYRYFNTGPNFSHNLTTEGRQTTAVAAEYYDKSMNNVPFSHGVLDFTDPTCQTGSGSCQASHWRDDQGLLMDPTLATGVLQSIKPRDIHAFDFIGWNKIFKFKISLKKIYLGWFLLSELSEIPSFGGQFEEFPELPPREVISFPANNGALALRAGFDLGYDGGIRSGLGYAKFFPTVGIPPLTVSAIPPSEGQQDLYPPGEQADNIPANLNEVFIQSDLEGVPFNFQSTCGENGCPFDPSLGTLGGYRVPGIVDGEGDEYAGDADAVLTLVMLLTDPSGIPDPLTHNVFENVGESEDNNIILLDPDAIGAILPAVCGDANHPIPLASLDGNCIVDLKDLVILAQQFMLCTAPVCL